MTAAGMTSANPNVVLSSHPMCREAWDDEVIDQRRKLMTSMDHSSGVSSASMSALLVNAGKCNGVARAGSQVLDESGVHTCSSEVRKKQPDHPIFFGCFSRGRHEAHRPLRVDVITDRRASRPGVAVVESSGARSSADPPVDAGFRSAAVA